MKANSDEMYDKYKDYDFADAKPVAETPPLAKLQAGGKSRITIRVDNEVLAFFKNRAGQEHGNYQTLINEALKQFAQGLQLADVVREAAQSAVAEALKKRAKG
jgi:uncharacterized protein (DUF4415 family)